MARILRVGELGMTKEDLFSKIPEIQADDLEESLVILEGRALVKREWADQVNYTAKSTIPGLVGLPTIEGGMGLITYADSEPGLELVPEPESSPGLPPPPPGSADAPPDGDGRTGGGKKVKRRVLAKGDKASTDSSRGSRGDSICPFLRRACRIECMLYMPERHVCAIHAIATDDNLAAWSAME